MSDNELGAYLRARRDAVSPADVGLPAGPRAAARRGYAGREVATLAGVSVEYLTRLEQGRDRHPSAQVLGAISDALGLSVDERLHLRLLTKATTGNVCPAAAPAVAIRPTVAALLDRLEPTPAIVVNRLHDVLAHTAGYASLAGPVGLLDGSNLARYVFTDPRARTAYPDWHHVADELAASLKQASYTGDHALAELTETLTITAGATFVDRLSAATGPPRRNGVQRFVHPEAGELRLAYEILDLPDADDQRMIVYLPADDATSTALGNLAGRRLRAVPS